MQQVFIILGIKRHCLLIAHFITDLLNFLLDNSVDFTNYKSTRGIQLPPISLINTALTE